MDFASLNWLAVIACVVASFAVGFVYFSPKVFFNTWWKALGNKDQPDMNTAEGKAAMSMVWVATTLGSIVLALGMAFVVPVMAGAMTGGVNALNGALTGLMLWIPFVGATSISNRMFAGHGLKVWAIEGGNHLLVMLLMGAILGAWR
jgi:uncharacterized protein DUF1761